MTKLTESAIEDFAIEQLEAQGFMHVYGPSIAPDSDTPERSRWDQVVLAGRLEAALKRINPDLPAAVLDTAIKEVARS